MIFTFQLQNSNKRYLMFAVDKEEAFRELKSRLGKYADDWSLIAYCPAEKFNLFLN